MISGFWNKPVRCFECHPVMIPNISPIVVLYVGRARALLVTVIINVLRMRLPSLRLKCLDKILFNSITSSSAV